MTIIKSVILSKFKKRWKNVYKTIQNPFEDQNSHFLFGAAEFFKTLKNLDGNKTIFISSIEIEDQFNDITKKCTEKLKVLKNMQN